MLNVEGWDDSKLVFKKVNMQGVDFMMGGFGDFPMASADMDGGLAGSQAPMQN